MIATALKVRTLEAGSVSGDVELSNLQVERLLAKTISGDISYDGVLPRGGRYEFNAHSGNVRIVLADTSGFELDASTFSGSIRSDFPVTLRATTRDEPRESQQCQPRRARHLRRRQRDSLGAKLFGHRRHHEEVADGRLR